MQNKFVRQSKLPRGAYPSSGQGLGYYAQKAADPDRLNWHALKFNVCPKCGKDFAKGLVTDFAFSDKMLTHPCGFKIRESKYSKIVSRQITQDLEEKEEDGI